MARKFSYYPQLDLMDCGPTCLKMISKFYGKNISVQLFRDKTNVSKSGVSLLSIANAAEAVGFHSLGIKISTDKLIEDIPLPCILHWKQNHFVVLYKVKKNIFSLNDLFVFSRNKSCTLHVADPSKGLLTYSITEFNRNWISPTNNEAKEGVALLLEPTQEFYSLDEDINNNNFDFIKLFTYLFKYKKLLIQLMFSLLVSSGLQLILPFITRSIVDVGIYTQNISYINILLIAQLVLMISRTSVDFIRSWIMLHISSRINLNIISDFLIKLMRLPVSYFETKQYGDYMQRINDHQRIESFLTGQTINVLFSTFNLIVFAIVLATFNLTIFSVFFISSLVYILWVLVFLKYRKVIDSRRFDVLSNNQNILFQIIQGMLEIKLANAQTSFRWAWERVQSKSINLHLKSLAINQYQQSGAFLINEGKNIFITFLAAQAVINGQLSLGTLLSIQYIIGQLNSPIDQLLQFVQGWQDSKLSLQRLDEIQKFPDEEPFAKPTIKHFSNDKSIYLKNVSFNYSGIIDDPVIEDVNIIIPEGKTTAIVGASGSGKTTILKLILKYYEKYTGEIKIGNFNIKDISNGFWRQECGIVMQDSFIFADTIAKNIALGEENIDLLRLHNSACLANIHDFIQSLPSGYNTVIGPSGHGISQGQRQRLFIARAIYKNPSYILLDEATNALDSHNEVTIVDNINNFFKGKTILVVAHRLSTIRNADQIIVLNKGQVVEVGTHEQLIGLNGFYHNLVLKQIV